VKTRWLVAYVAGLVTVSTLLYHTLEGWSLPDSLFFTITVLCSGYGYLTPSTEAGRAWTAAVNLLGVGAFGLLVLKTVEVGLKGGIRDYLLDIRTTWRLKRMRNHVVVCGYGRVGRRVVDRLLAMGLEVVVVDGDEDAVEDARRDGVPAVHGDLRERTTLRAAGVERARSVVVCTDQDEINVYATILARRMNPDARIVAVSRDPDGMEVLKDAGADDVVDAFHAVGDETADTVTRDMRFRVTVKHTVDEVEEEWNAIVENGGTLLDVRFHVPGSPEPVVKELPIRTREDLERRRKLLEESEEFRRTVEALHALSRGVHSHTVLAVEPDAKERIVRALEEKGFLIGVDMTHEQVLKEVFEGNSPEER